jgi:hypothetical protein
MEVDKRRQKAKQKKSFDNLWPKLSFFPFLWKKWGMSSQNVKRK